MTRVVDVFVVANFASVKKEKHSITLCCTFQLVSEISNFAKEKSCFWSVLMPCRYSVSLADATIPAYFPSKDILQFPKRHDQGRSSGVGPGSGQGGKIAAAAAGGGERRWNSGGRKEELDRQIGKQRFQALDNSV